MVKGASLNELWTQSYLSQYSYPTHEQNDTRIVSVVSLGNYYCLTCSTDQASTNPYPEHIKMVATDFETQNRLHQEVAAIMGNTRTSHNWHWNQFLLFLLLVIKLNGYLDRQTFLGTMPVSMRKRDLSRIAREPYTVRAIVWFPSIC